MKSSVFIFVFYAIVFLMASGINNQANAKSVSELWDEMEEAMRNNLPKTATEKLNLIYQEASKQKMRGDMVKAKYFLTMIKLADTMQGAHPDKDANILFVENFNKEIEESDKAVKPVMKLLLAKWFWEYYEENSYRFRNRTRTDKYDEKDFSTWDLPKLFNHIGELYQNLLSNEHTLKTISTEEISSILERGNLPDSLRPTFFDFFAHEALEFYCNEAQNFIKPENAFEIDSSSPALAPYEEFIKWEPQTNDTESSLPKAIKLYQKLLKHNLETGNTNGFIDNDLHRLEWAYSEAVGEGTRDKYISTLQKIADKYPNNKYAAIALSQIGQEYRNSGDNVKALEYCDKVINMFKIDNGFNFAKELAEKTKNEILKKYVSIETERIITPGSAKVKISYTNITKLYFRLIERKESELIQADRYSPDSIGYNMYKSILQRTPKKEWSIDLEECKDYKNKTVVVDVPIESKGLYYLFASVNPEFSENHNAINGTVVTASNLSTINRKYNGKNEIIVVDAISGVPVKDAEIKVLSYIYERRGWIEQTKGKTDIQGFYRFNSFDTYNTSMFIVKYNDDIVYKLDDFVIRQYNDYRENYSIQFFTDRSIYRPGQTVYYKGIAYSYDTGTNKYQTLENKIVEITFLDPNGKKIETTVKITNKFGSFNGSFVSPTDRLTGQYRIRAVAKEHYNISGTTYIRIEEYKRPKFKVELSQPKEEYKLGDEVSLKGTARGYNGAAIDDASVSYRVVRKVRFPYWFWWITPISSSEEITHGKVKSDSEGKFEIKFKATPDRSIPEKDEPVFWYEVSADVTDNNGETRSDNTTVKIGYTALSISMSCQEEYEANSNFEIKVNTSTLNGEPISAKCSLEVYSLVQPQKPARKSYFRDTQILKSDLSDPRNWEKDELIKLLNFSTDSESGNSKCIIDGLPEGAYRVFVTSKDKYGKEVKAEHTLLSVDSKASNFGIKIPFYVKSNNSDLKPGDVYEAVWATGYNEGLAFIEVEHRKQLVQSYWAGGVSNISKSSNSFLTSTGRNKAIVTVPITEDVRGGFTVRIIQIKENREYTKTIDVPVPWDNKKLDLKFSRMHSKLEPGASDIWQIEITGEEAEKNAIEMVAAMYDASLDAYASHSWLSRFNPFYRNYAGISNGFLNRSKNFDQWENSLNSYVSFHNRTYTHFTDEITESLHQTFRMARLRRVPRKLQMAGARSGMRMMQAVPMNAMSDGMVEEACLDDCAVEKESMVNSFAASKSIQTKGLSTNAIAAANFDSGSAQKAEEPKEKEEPKIDLDKVKARANLNETAFFYPNLLTNDENSVTIEFRMPEALTTWKFMGFAHGTGLQSGSITAETITQKDFMIEPNAPRFLREGDKLAFSTKITNLTDKPLTGKIALTISDPVTERSLNDQFGINTEQKFKVEANKSTSVSWLCNVPDMAGLVKYKVVGSTGKLSDGEEGWMPILSRYLFVTESIPMPINGPASKNFTFKKLTESANSNTLKHKALTLEVTSNPAWYAVQALPYLMEYPYECSEQTFNRYYANMLAAYIANSDPKIKRVFEVWKRMEPLGGKALISNLEKNQELKAVALQETPWVMDAENETAQKHRIGLLFDDNNLKNETDKCLNKLKQMQSSDGGFPWFPGGLNSDYITLYIMTGFGRLQHLGVKTDMAPAIKTLSYLDNMLVKNYIFIKEHDKDYLKNNHMSSFYAMYLYGRTFFIKNHPIDSRTKEAYDYFTDQAEKHWQGMARMSQAHIALALHRMNRNKVPSIIMQSLMERSKFDEEMGRFWKDGELSLYWYRADIETQAMMIEAFSDISNDEKAVEECKIWLIKQKQTQQWKSTKATADAIYSLIIKGADILAADKLVTAELGGVAVKPENAEAGTGYYKKVWSGGEVKPEMGKVVLTKPEKGVAWGALHWQYMEDISKVTGHETNLKLEKSLFIKQNTSKGPTLVSVKDGKLNVGDLVTVRIVLRTDRDMEFVHMKDGRGSGMEPVNVLSRWRYQDGLGYYEATKDTATNFFIDYLPKGSYVFEYDLRVQHAGEYQTGMAEIQCMYAPEFNSHSNSIMLKVTK